MEEMSRLMVSENQSSQARNTLLKDRLQNLKGRGTLTMLLLSLYKHNFIK